MEKRATSQGVPRFWMTTLCAACLGTAPETGSDTAVSPSGLASQRGGRAGGRPPQPRYRSLPPSLGGPSLLGPPAGPCSRFRHVTHSGAMAFAPLWAGRRVNSDHCSPPAPESFGGGRHTGGQRRSERPRDRMSRCHGHVSGRVYPDTGGHGGGGVGLRRAVAELRPRDTEGLSEKKGRPGDVGRLHHVEA